MGMLKNKKNRVLFLIISSLALTTLLVLEWQGVINLHGGNRTKVTSVNPDNRATTSSNAPTAQSDFSEGGPREPLPSSTNEGFVLDNRGVIDTIPPQSQWTRSKDSLLTVYTPTTNNTVKKGDTISGKTNLSSVSFRLIDDITGVIAQGSLSVVEGRFSGTLDFATTATNGRLDLYHSAADGVESSNVEIPINF